jgi:hypothetical protein
MHGNDDDKDENASKSTVDLKRWGLLAGGSALALYGLTRRSKKGMTLAAAGGLMAAQGAKMTVYPREIHAQTSFAINCPPERAYQFWRNFENLPKFMHHLQSVENIEGGRFEWTALGPMETPVRWTAEIVDERENERIAWRSLSGSASPGRPRHARQFVFSVRNFGGLRRESDCGDPREGSRIHDSRRPSALQSNSRSRRDTHHGRAGTRPALGCGFSDPLRIP